MLGGLLTLHAGILAIVDSRLAMGPPVPRGFSIAWLFS
jgi:hypothetical protein